MSKRTVDQKPTIDPDMTLLDFISRSRHTEAVFKQYDEKSGVCLCCQAFFDPLQEVADKYGLELDWLLVDIELTARDDESP